MFKFRTIIFFLVFVFCAYSLSHAQNSPINPSALAPQSVSACLPKNPILVEDVSEAFKREIRNLEIFLSQQTDEQNRGTVLLYMPEHPEEQKMQENMISFFSEERPIQYIPCTTRCENVRFEVRPVEETPSPIDPQEPQAPPNPNQDETDTTVENVIIATQGIDDARFRQSLLEEEWYKNVGFFLSVVFTSQIDQKQIRGLAKTKVLKKTTRRQITITLYDKDRCRLRQSIYSTSPGLDKEQTVLNYQLSAGFLSLPIELDELPDEIQSHSALMVTGKQRFQLKDWWAMTANLSIFGSEAPFFGDFNNHLSPKTVVTESESGEKKEKSIDRKLGDIAGFMIGASSELQWTTSYFESTFLELSSFSLGGGLGAGYLFLPAVGNSGYLQWQLQSTFEDFLISYNYYMLNRKTNTLELNNAVAIMIGWNF